MIKANEGFILQKMLDAYMIIAVGEGVKAFNGIIQTNETGAFFWRMIEKGTTPEEMVQAAMERYEDLEEPVARRDIEEFLESISPALKRTDD